MRNLLLCLFIFSNLRLAYCQPCLEGWGFRKEVQITSIGSASLSAYQVKITWDMLSLINEGKLQVDGNDLRVLTETGQVLSHWIEPQTINTTSALLWVKIPSILQNQSISIYLFYGNKTAPNIANGNSTFDFFDDFDNQVGVDPSRWQSCGTTQVSDGKCTFSSSSSASSHSFLTSVKRFSGQVNAEMYVESVLGGGHLGLYDPSRNQGYGIHSEQANGQTFVFMSLMTSQSSCYTLLPQTPDKGALPSGQLIGQWGFSRANTGNNHLLDWPGASTHPIIRNDNSYVNTGTDQVMVGNGGQTGTMKIDWIRVRKYALVEPDVLLKSEANLIAKLTPKVQSPVCEGTDVQFLIDSISGATYTWEGPNGFTSSNASPIINNSTPRASGIYKVSMVVANGCPKQESEVILKVDSLTSNGIVEGNTSACEGSNSGKVKIRQHVGSVVRWETSSSGFEPWQTVTSTKNELSYTNLKQTTYFRSLVKSGVCAGVFTDSVLVELASRPEGGKVTGPQPTCILDEKSTLDLIGYKGSVARWEMSTNGFSTFKIIDSTQAVLPVSNITSNTSFRALIESGTCPKVYSIPFDVVIYPTPVASFSVPEACDGEALKFENNSTISSGTITASLWDFGDQQNSVQQSPSYTYLNFGEYNVTLQVTSSYGCVDDTIQLVRINELPLANFTATNACFGEAISLQNLSSISVGVLSYEWHLGDGRIITEESPSYEYNQPGNYEVRLKVTSEKGCIDSLIRIVSQFVPPTIQASNDTIVSKGFSTILNVKGGEMFFWEPIERLNDPNIFNPEATPLETTTYTVIGVDENGCSGQDSVNVEVKDDFVLVVPNLITPDGNGKNDVWMITNIENYSTSVKVFNRLGKLVFESSNYQNDWNGLDGKDILPDGAYYYVITFEESEVRYQGAISILRNK